MRQVRFTQEGYDQLKKDYEAMQKQRPPAVEDLKKAREMGDLKENGYYKASRSKLTSIDINLFRMKLSLKQAVIVNSRHKDLVEIGRTVILTDNKKELVYQIVGDLESDPSQGKISLLSPIGKAIAGKKVGMEISIQVPAGDITYKIASIV